MLHTVYTVEKQKREVEGARLKIFAVKLTHIHCVEISVLAVSIDVSNQQLLA